MIRIATALSTDPRIEAAVAEGVAELRAEFGDIDPDLLIVFISPHHARECESLPRRLREFFPRTRLFGTTADGVIGDGREVESSCALSFWAASLPDVSIDALHLVCRQEEEEFIYEGWEEPGERSAEGALLLVDPFSNMPNLLFDELARRYGSIPIVGGIASGGRMPGSNVLFLDEEVHRFGSVVLIFSGAVEFNSIVSQGCRPIGRHFVITDARDNVIFQIAGQPALKKFEEVFRTLDEDDQELARRSLHVGHVINEYQDCFDRGDFLIRNCMGFDPECGAIVVNEQVRRGQTIQFHVRDAGSASEDLRLLLQGVGGSSAGGLLFTCSGRGERMFGMANHDAQAVQEEVGPLPVAGFFAGGEIGPVSGQTCLHGFSASLALFSSPDLD